MSFAGADQSGYRTDPPALKGRTRIEEPTRGQRSIARRTAETRATVPDLELSSDVEIASLLSLSSDRAVSLGAVLVRACALALRAHPRANAAYRDGRFELYSRVNIGVVIHTPGSYITPTVLDADEKSLHELDGELVTLSESAAAGTLVSPELAGATFTVADLSGLGVDRWGPLTSPPQAAALTAGAVRSAPVIRDGTVVAGRVIGLSLACDHRILFGAEAASFFNDICRRLRTAEL